MSTVTRSCLLGLALLAVMLAPATASPRAKTTKLKVDAKLTSFFENDVGPSGKSEGDAFQGTDTLTRQAKAKKVGTDDFSCVRMQPATNFECDWTVVLHDGSLQMAGLGVDSDAPYTIPVIGGTGRYTGAHGTMTVKNSTEPVAQYDLKFSTR